SGKSAGAGAKPESDMPFRMLVIGDFSGRASRGVVEPLAGRRATLVDIDNLDQALARLKPEVLLARDDGNVLRITFAAFDDFHPDRIFERVPIFQKLREKREALGDPATASAA